MATREIFELGNPVLRVKCTPVKQFEGTGLATLIDDLRDTLYDFRREHGFGRGIAAPQIGVTQRVIFVDVGNPVALINPVIVRRSRRMMTLWDDCFSFPDLLAKVRRNLVIEVRYQDRDGHTRRLEAEGALSELLQHEIDHLDGILAIDRAIDSKHIAYRRELEKREKTTEEVVL
jgi:peptide deformylase